MLEWFICSQFLNMKEFMQMFELNAEYYQDLFGMRNRKCCLLKDAPSMYLSFLQRDLS